MNAALESLIDKIKRDEFSDTEIILISETDIFSNQDLLKLEEAINANEWIKDNLKVLMLEPNNIVEGALGIDGSRGFFVKFKHAVNSIDVSTKVKLTEVLEKLRTDNFHYSRIRFGDNRFSTGIAELDDSDLQELITAINESEWCQQYLKSMDLDHAHVTRLPALKCRNLREIRIYTNPIDQMEELSCPNLRHIVAHYIGKFDIKALQACSNLEQIDAFGSNLRVPPNVMPYPMLRSLHVLDSSPFSPLGIYALLLMKRHKHLEIGYNRSDLTKKFAQTLMQHPDFRITEGFYDHPLSYWGIEPLSNIDADKFIDEFEIPQQFFRDQVAAVVSFMRKIYHIEVPIEVSEDGMVTVDRNVPPSKFANSAKLDKLNAEYRNARGILFSSVEGLFERDNKHGDIGHDNILNKAKERCAEYLSSLEIHNHFLLSELYSDFDTLRDIFNTVGKPQHAEALSSYMMDDCEQWQQQLDVKQMLFDAAKQHLDQLCSQKRNNQVKEDLLLSDVPLESQEEEHPSKKLKEDGTEKTTTKPASRWQCVIS